MRRLRDGEWIAGAGAAALIASMFLHWYGLEIFDVVALEATAWQMFDVLDIVLTLLAVVPLALVLTQATRESPAIPVFFSVMTVLAGLVAALLILYRIVNQPGSNADVDVQLGAWLGFLAAVVVGVGGWRSMRGESVPGRRLPPIEDRPEPAP